MATLNMNLVLPVPTVTLGPSWAAQLNSSLELIDSHDHTEGKGKRITPSAININSDFNINSQNLNNVRSLRLINNASALIGASDIRSLYVVDGDLYYNNAAGTSVQVTDGIQLAAVPAGASTSYERVSTSGPLFSITAVDTFSFVGVNSTSGAVTVALPAASSVASGRFYFIKDTLGQSAINNITVDATGADLIDGLGAIVLNAPFSAIQVVSNGTDRWDVYNVAIEDDSIVTSKILNEAVTPAKIEPGTNGQVLATEGGTVVWRDYLNAETQLTSLAASNWESFQTDSTTKFYTDVIYANNVYVAVGFSGAVSTSVNGKTWTSRTASQSNSWNAIAYGAGLFVAVSQDGTNRVMTSPDGITWTNRTAASASIWISLKFLNSLFIATASGGECMTSTDGINWTSRTTPEANQWWEVARGNGLYVSVADFGTQRAMYSSDGITWSSGTIPSGDYRSIAFGNGVFVAMGAALATSTDGITFTSRTSPSSVIRSVTFYNGVFVAVGVGVVFTSLDGINWTQKNPSEALTWNKVVFGRDEFICVAQTGTNRVMTSLSMGL